MNLMTLIPAAQKWWNTAKTAEDDIEFEAAWAQVFPRVDLDPIESISPGIQPRAEPVARVHMDTRNAVLRIDMLRPLSEGEHVLYTHPQQGERKPLTDEQTFVWVQLESGIEVMIPVKH